MSLHARSDDELKEKLSSGELGDKKTAIAEAVLRHRRTERMQAWLKRHVWFAAWSAHWDWVRGYCRLSATKNDTRIRIMDKDRIKGSAEQAKGKVKEVAGKLTGDAKLESEGKADKAEGKIRNAVGGLKDTLRGK